MKKIFEYKFIVLLLLIFSTSVFGQTPEKIEMELVSHIENIKTFSGYGGDSDYDLLGKENELFKQKLLKYTKTASTLKYNFSELDKHIYISTSEDETFRIYSWDTETGGTMHFFETVYQFQGKNAQVFSKGGENDEEGVPGSFVYDIFTLDTKSGNVYLACSTSILSTSDVYQSVNLFKIENDALNDKIKLIKTKTGLQNSLGFEYDFFSVVEREERPIKLIQYDKTSKTIIIPVVLEDEKFPYGKVTDRFIKYKFNGTYFVKTK